MIIPMDITYILPILHTLCAIHTMMHVMHAVAVEMLVEI